MPSCSVLVRPGVAVPAAAVAALWAILNAGHRLRLEGDGENLLIEPRRGIAVDEYDLQQLRRWRASCIVYLAGLCTDERQATTPEVLEAADAR